MAVSMIRKLFSKSLALVALGLSAGTGSAEATLVVGEWDPHVRSRRLQVIWVGAASLNSTCRPPA